MDSPADGLLSGGHEHSTQCLQKPENPSAVIRERPLMGSPTCPVIPLGESGYLHDIFKIQNEIVDIHRLSQNNPHENTPTMR